MRRLRLRYLLLVGVPLVVGGFIAALVLFANEEAVEYDPISLPESFPEHEARGEVTPDTRPAFLFDPARSWQIDLGRGSGMDGLDTMSLSSDGRTVVYRAKMVHTWNGYSRTWKRAALTLPPDAVQRIADAVNAEHLPDLGRHYDGKCLDGTQWVLWLRQGGREKVVYFDNHFPEPVVRFAAAVDAELVAVGDAVRWRGVPFWEQGQHDDELWRALRR